jgi:DNA-binding MarR family transcriptional regulator
VTSRSKTRPATLPARPPQKTAYLVGRLDRVLRRRIAEAIAPYGLTVPQYTALSVLDARGALSNAQLAERSLTSPQAANEMVKAMEEHGWLLREPHPSHGRILHLKLTPRGRALLAECDAAVDAVEVDLLRELLPGERGELQRLLRACLSALSSDLIER